ncbi:Crp/Fnr family transcriptional regulator [Peptacetobacter hominis]|uniref:Crp/Fnr family transcriptional regulator n=1 Tax=Peptacetobacter hominis TaxID=2743610 RepID=A0A544QT49_9FIRM|nr:Crp/Fnr family transcriptional regulator [Peptacetobacter hominis]TQQ83217.1 Crp/Fnr family transcriptional regulator [Peptacetobacter hominis]
MLNHFEEISSFPLFNGISSNDLEMMFKCFGIYKRKYLKDEIIFLECQDIKFIGVIIHGKVHMIKEDLDGNNSILVYMSNGDIIGESFACGIDTISKVSFIANKDTEILFIPFHKIVNMCKMTCSFHHKLIENMLKVISTKNIMLINKIEIVSKKKLRDKIMSYLQLQKSLSNDEYFKIPLGRTELADYLCSDRSALTRELYNMKREGLIEFEKNIFKINIDF